MELSNRDDGVLIHLDARTRARLRESSPIMDFLCTVTPARAPARVVPNHSAIVHRDARARARVVPNHGDLVHRGAACAQARVVPNNRARRLS